jgi:hypothetical protein
MTICGEVEGSRFRRDRVGSFRNFRDYVYISDKAKANLLSFPLVSKQYNITWNQNNLLFSVETENEILNFRNDDDLFVWDVRKDYRSQRIYGESVYGLKGRMSHRKPNTVFNVKHFQSLVDN